MKQVNIDITEIVHELTRSKLSKMDYLAEIKAHKKNPTLYFLRKYKNTGFKRIVGKDRRGKEIIITEKLTDMIAHEHSVSRSTAAQAILNLERKE